MRSIKASNAKRGFNTIFFIESEFFVHTVERLVGDKDQDSDGLDHNSDFPFF